MVLDRRNLLAALAVSVGGVIDSQAAFSQSKAKPDDPATTVTVTRDPHPPTMARIAISPDGQRLAYVIGRAIDQKVLVINLSDMSQSVYPLGSVFMTEMMWGSNSQILTRLRYFQKINRKDHSSLIQTRYIWLAIDLDNPKRKPLPINAYLTEMSRVERPEGFGLVFENRVISTPYIPDIANDLAGKSLGDQLMILSQASQAQEQLNRLAEQRLDQGDTTLDFDLDDDNLGPYTANAYDNFIRLDLATEKMKTILSLDTLAPRYAISSDGQIIAYASRPREKKEIVVSYRNGGADNGEPYTDILKRPLLNATDLVLEGLGHDDSTLLISQDNRSKYYELSPDGVLADLTGVGTPIFDGYSHLHVGFRPNDPDLEPVYVAEKWVRIWNAVKSMAPSDAIVKVESHAKDARKLVISLKLAKSEDRLYHFIDLSNGRTEFITRTSPYPSNSAAH